MPATLYFSNALDALATRLIGNIRDGGSDPFVAPSIATPASAMRDWLKIRIAEEMKVSANIAFPHLENLLWERLAERDRFRNVEGRQPARLLDTFSFQGLVLAQLRRAPPQHLEEYLNTGEPTEDARRICQLSGKLAALFREYEYNRVAENGSPSLAASWMQGKPCFETRLTRGARNHPATARIAEVRELETWQMAVYQALFRKDDGLRDQWGNSTGTYRYTLPQYAEMVLSEAPSAKDTETSVPATVSTVFHLFGLSNISPFHRDLIGRLADADMLGERAVRFEIYALNPCAEFWEDALTVREKRARAPRRIDPEKIRAARPSRSEIENAELDEVEGENGLLALFGKPGRETIKLWCQLTGHDFHEDFRDPRAATLLATVQKSVLSRAGSLPSAEESAPQEISRVRADHSLRIRSAPDPRAEMECVRAEAAELLRTQPDLRPEDMAIIPANPDAALSLIRSVFAGGREAPGNVPLLLPGGDAPEGGPLLRGFRDLLSPAVLAGDRNALLALLENPAVARKAGLAAERLRAVRNFLESAGFQEGWESSSAGGSTAHDAEERAVLALALDPDDDALEAAELWPARDTISLLEREEIARVIAWLSHLRGALRPFRSAPGQNLGQTFGQWAEILRTLLDDFLKPEEDGAADKRAELDLRRFFAEMALWDHWGSSEKSDDGVTDRVSGDLIRMLFEDAFRDPGTPRSAFLRGGVRVGGLSALRGIPFRHVWVTGLAAGEFPASGEAAPLDLRGYRRLPGENDPAARDLYALLEVIASTTETLTLSWTRRDAAKDAEVPPSRALTGLKAWIESDILVQDSADGRADNAAEAFPFSVTNVPPVYAGTTYDPGVYPVVWAETSAESFAQNSTRKNHAVDWRDLTDYLNNPASHAATRHFGLQTYDALNFDEPERAAALFLDKRTKRGLIDAAFRTELLEPGAGSLAFDRLWKTLAHGGRIPPSPYGAIEEERLRAEVEGQVVIDTVALHTLLQERGLRFAGSLRVGPQGPVAAEPPVVSIPAFDATPLGCPVQVGGLLPWFFQGSGPMGGWALLLEEGHELSAYLLQLSAAAFDAQAPLRGPATLFTRKKNGGIDVHGLPVLEAVHARADLQTLLRDFGNAPDFDDLPLGVIEELRHDADKVGRAIGNWSEEIETQRREDEEKSHTRITFNDRVLRTLRPAVPADAGEKIARRIQPYLDWIQGWDAGGAA
jgi:exonuclease V gamma subunit